MNILTQVKIKGFWGNRDITFDTHSDVNFIIGVNGSGKTTVINLVAAALNVDFINLDRIAFKQLDLKLTNNKVKESTLVSIQKELKERSTYASIQYVIDDNNGRAEYSLDKLEEERLLRQIPPSQYHRYFARANAGLQEHIKSLVNVSWLSIHRTLRQGLAHEDRSFESSIDVKLEDLGNSLVRLFSVLQKKVSEEIETFQKEIILSLLAEPKQTDLFSQVRKLNLDQEKISLIEIFKELEIPKRRTEPMVEKHYAKLQEAVDNLDNEQIEFEDMMTIIGTTRIHRVVQEWNKLLDKKKDIYELRDTFLFVVNELFQKKKIVINDDNEISAITQSKKELKLSQLSSGEKQLFIILGEALLQEKSPWIYIADEPELSLHVSWQESLIDNLRRINPNAQILCATHSPDIVGGYSKKVFDMEKLLN